MLATREDSFIKQFLSAYEGGSWADADVTKPDAIDRTNPSVDQLATRKVDRRILAIEHTIIEPFVGEKEDFAAFDTAFDEIEADTSLIVHGRWLEVFVPVGILRKRTPTMRRTIVQAVHAWIRENRLAVPEGRSVKTCHVVASKKPSFDITLNIKVTPLKRGAADEPGRLHVRRQQMDDTLGDVIERALRNKLPKLINTKADKCILLFERQHPNLFQKMILDEIGKRRTSFPELARVDIWIVETAYYGTTFGGTYLRFEHYDKDGKFVQSYDFNKGRLTSES